MMMNNVLYCKNKEVNESTTILEMMVNYYKHGTPATYYKDETIQCPMGKRRSFEDVLMLIKSKFPNATIEDLYKNFREFKKQTDEFLKKTGYVISIFECPDIGNVVISSKSNYYDIDGFSGLRNIGFGLTNKTKKIESAIMKYDEK